MVVVVVVLGSATDRAAATERAAIPAAETESVTSEAKSVRGMAAAEMERAAAARARVAAATAATAAAWARVAAARGKERLGFAVAPEGPGFAVAPEGMGFAEFPVDWDFAEFPADWGFAAVLVDWGFVNSWPDELRPAPRGMSSSEQGRRRRRDAQVTRKSGRLQQEKFSGRLPHGDRRVADADAHMAYRFLSNSRTLL